MSRVQCGYSRGTNFSNLLLSISLSAERTCSIKEGGSTRLDCSADRVTHELLEISRTKCNKR